MARNGLVGLSVLTPIRLRGLPLTSLKWRTETGPLLLSSIRSQLRRTGPVRAQTMTTRVGSHLQPIMDGCVVAPYQHEHTPGAAGKGVPRPYPLPIASSMYGPACPGRLPYM